jgi:hypothetical protein
LRASLSIRANVVESALEGVETPLDCLEPLSDVAHGSLANGILIGLLRL